MTAMLFGAHDGYAPHNLPARIVFMEQKSRQPLAGIVRSAGDEDEMRCSGGASNEVLDAIDDPMVALFNGGGLHHARIRTRTRGGFGHGEGRLHIAVSDRPQPALFLSLGGNLA